MKFNPKITSKALFTIVGGAVLINPAFAQEQASEELEEVVVTGLRGSLKASMETKRDAIGVVDAINAEDIGKFPDTNLSEALQRITGVSIDRRNGEGATVTARGFGPQFNMITLNGRQMPSADAYGGGELVTGGFGAQGRSFNFSNLAAEAISAVEVYKTGRADVATGGIGATINVRTARPLDNDGVVLNLGAKVVNDTTNRVGDDFTPEVSGIFSYATEDKRFGVGVSASYQKRDLGSSTSTVNDWHIQAWDASNGGINATNRTAAPLYFSDNGTPGDPTDDINAVIENAPANGQLYGIPNDIRYAFSDMERERVNVQGAIQFAPMENLTLTVDYTWARNDLVEDRGEQTIWLQRNGFDRLVFDTGRQVATPVLLHEFTGANKDFGYEQQHREQRNDINSMGFNASWDVADNFNLGFDYHDSRAGSHPSDPITGGSQTAFSLAGKVNSDGTSCARGVTPGCTNFWTQQFEFNTGLPVASRTLFPTSSQAYANTGGNADYTFGNNLGSQILRIQYQEQNTEIQQSRIDGKFKFENGGSFNFGVETRAMETHQLSSGSNLTMGDWGATDTGQQPNMVALLEPFSITGAFDDFNPAGAPTGGVRGNANELGLWAINSGAAPGTGRRYNNWTEASAPDGQLRYNPGFNTDSTVQEDTLAVYAQVALKLDFGSKPANLVIGARYEETDVNSVNLQLVPEALLWQDDNDFQVVRGTVPQLVDGSGSYNNFLPNIDFDIGLTDSLKARVSYSKTIARAGYGTLAAGQTVGGGGGGSTLNGAIPTGGQNNPGILPLESDNYDISIEYYFSDTGYVSAGAFLKNVENFIGNSVRMQNLFGIRDQTGGPAAQQAYAFLRSAQCTAQNGGSACGTSDSHLFTATAMILNPGQFTDSNGTWTGGLANYNNTEAQHVAFATKYDILPTPQDPLTTFAVNTPVNNQTAQIHGFEFGGQYFFGDSGFGILANYTIVDGDIGFDVTADPNQNQFALTGLSDSANAVLMFEKFGLSARLAYNWRDEFLSQINQGGWRNPYFVEAYDQIDLSVGYDINDNFAVSLEAINLTGEDVRWHGRSELQLWRLEDQGARYAIGARYKF